MISVVKAEYLSEYKIHLEFNNGKKGEVDFEEIIKCDQRPIFKQLEDISTFKDFRIDFDTLIWPNELDLAPEFLYFQAFKHDPQLGPQFRDWGYLN